MILARYRSSHRNILQFQYQLYIERDPYGSGHAERTEWHYRAAYPAWCDSRGQNPAGFINWASQAGPVALREWDPYRHIGFVSIRGVDHGGGWALSPNVLRGGVQLLNAPTQYLTRQRLPMAYVKLFLVVFAFLLILSSTSLSSSLLALTGCWHITVTTSGVCHVIRGGR